MTIGKAEVLIVIAYLAVIGVLAVLLLVLPPEGGSTVGLLP